MFYLSKCFFQYFLIIFFIFPTNEWYVLLSLTAGGCVFAVSVAPQSVSNFFNPNLKPFDAFCLIGKRIFCPHFSRRFFCLFFFSECLFFFNQINNKRVFFIMKGLFNSSDA